jgi:hypothetical protein
MDCNSMLKDIFAYARKGIIRQGNDFPTHFTVFVTITVHMTNDHADKNRDTVWYADGPLKLTKGKTGETLDGLIPMVINNIDIVTLQQSGSEILLPLKDIFPSNSMHALMVSISDTGTVSVQRYLNNRIFMNRPPVTFQATCTDGLLTIVKNGASYTLSFTLGRE